MRRRLTSDQAREVARRLDPRGTSRVRFSADGTVVSSSTPVEQWQKFEVEVWDCWRDEGVVHTVKVV